VTLVKRGNDLVVHVLNSGDTIMVKSQFTSSTDFWGIEQIQFADGTVLNKAAIAAAAIVLGTNAAETLTGTSDADVVNGLGGNDTLQGGNGGDTYLYGVGSGGDTIVESASDSGTDVLKLVGLNASDVEFRRWDNDVFVKILATGEELKLQNQFSGATGIEQVSFADGTVWDRSQIASAAWYRGTANGESLSGSSGDDTFDGKGGNDTLRGYGGSDTYVYRIGSGGDTIAESGADAGTDVLKLVGLNASDVEFRRWGNDVFVKILSTGEELKVENQFNNSGGIEQVNFADGSTLDRAQIASAAWYRGSANGESINGSSLDDTFDGKGGNDTLSGYVGSDTYIYGVGSGDDTIAESGADAGTDVLKLIGLNASDVEFRRWGNDAFVKILATGEEIKVQNQFNNSGGIEQVSFADGSTMDRAQIASAAWYRGSANGEGINGSSLDDTFDGKGGNDSLSGYVGSDTYIYGVGSGNDTVTENGADAGTDNIKLVGLNASDVEFMRWGNNLYVTIIATGERITVERQFENGWGVEQVTFADGAIWDRAQIASAAWLRGTSGNDSISGTSGNDTIFGGAGNDTMAGGAGNDTFVFRANLGQDTVTDFTVGSDVLEFRDGIFADAAAVLAAATASGSDTLITIDAGNTILLKNVAVANLHVGDFHIV
jgi:Ca2+-binding RTX toxin-like protein